MSKRSEHSSAAMKRGHMGMRGRGPAEKAKDFKGTMGRLIRYLKPYRINILVAFAFSICSVAVSYTHLVENQFWIALSPK